MSSTFDIPALVDFFEAKNGDTPRYQEFLRASAEKPRGKKTGRPKGTVSAKTQIIRSAVLELTSEYDVMTVRQVFYQLVSRGIVPKDENAGYRPVQAQVLQMRRAGWLPWSFIADGTRWMRKPESFLSVDDAIASMHRSYRRDLWQSQNVRIEVWLEKDALAGVVSTATNAWDVPLMVSRGTSSATFLHSAGETARNAWVEHGIATRIYAMYDFDAAGQRAARNVEAGIVEHAGDETPISFELLAVNESQIEAWQLPTRPAKKTDPEAAKFGNVSVELDAIPPDKLVALVEGAITDNIATHAWEQEQISEASERAFLETMVSA